MLLTKAYKDLEELQKKHSEELEQRSNTAAQLGQTSGLYSNQQNTHWLPQIKSLKAKIKQLQAS